MVWYCSPHHPVLILSSRLTCQRTILQERHTAGRQMTLEILRWMSFPPQPFQLTWACVMDTIESDANTLNQIIAPTFNKFLSLHVSITNIVLELSTVCFHDNTICNVTHSLSSLIFKNRVAALPDRGFETSCLLHCSRLTVSANSEDSWKRFCLSSTRLRRLVTLTFRRRISILLLTYLQWKPHHSMFSCVDTVLECNRRTDGQTTPIVAYT